jgi:hypothetical protein
VRPWRQNLRYLASLQNKQSKQADSNETQKNLFAGYLDEKVFSQVFNYYLVYKGTPKPNNKQDKKKPFKN